VTQAGDDRIAATDLGKEILFTKGQQVGLHDGEPRIRRQSIG
jgi:hypothetical protein